MSDCSYNGHKLIYLAPLCCCAAASFLTILIGKIIFFLGPWSSTMSSEDGWSLSIAIIIPLVLTTALQLFMLKSRISLSKILQFLYVLLVLLVIVNIIWQFIPFAEYGDSGCVGLYIKTSTVYPRWFLGISLLDKCYHSVWVTIASYLPWRLSSPHTFGLAMGTLIMGGSTVLLLVRHGNRLCVLVPILMPIWILFCAGYDEYYPFIAWGYLCILLLLLKGFEARSPLFMAGSIALLSISYAGYVPIAFFVFASYALRVGFKKALIVGVLSIIICAIALIILWPRTFVSFFPYYFQELNLGEQGTAFYAYKGKSSGLVSPFFSADYALSGKHLMHLCFMLLFGAGIVPLLLIALTLISVQREKIRLQFWGDKGVVLSVCAVFALQVFYFIFMIPKLGPVQDIDLFFAFYLTVGFVGGLCAEKLATIFSPIAQKVFILCVLGASLGSSGAVLVKMLKGKGLYW